MFIVFYGQHSEPAYFSKHRIVIDILLSEWVIIILILCYYILYNIFFYHCIIM